MLVLFTLVLSVGISTLISSPGCRVIKSSTKQRRQLLVSNVYDSCSVGRDDWIALSSFVELVCDFISERVTRAVSLIDLLCDILVFCQGLKLLFSSLVILQRQFAGELLLLSVELQNVCMCKSISPSPGFNENNDKLLLSFLLEDVFNNAIEGIVRQLKCVDILFFFGEGYKCCRIEDCFVDGVEGGDEEMESL